MDEKTNITPEDLMKFLQSFKTSMEDSNEKLQLNLEDKLEKTNEKIEQTNVKIEARIEGIDKELRELKEKTKDAVVVNKRMENRLNTLEHEMNKSKELRRRTEHLRNTLKDKDIIEQPDKTPVNAVERERTRAPQQGNMRGGKHIENIPVSTVMRNRAQKNELEKHEKNKHKTLRT